MAIRDDELNTSNYAFFRFNDLLKMNIVASRADLYFRQQKQGFPKPLRMAPGQGATALFRRRDVMEWLDKNLIETPEAHSN